MQLILILHIPLSLGTPSFLNPFSLYFRTAHLLSGQVSEWGGTFTLCQCKSKEFFQVSVCAGPLWRVLTHSQTPTYLYFSQTFFLIIIWWQFYFNCSIKDQYDIWITTSNMNMTWYNTIMSDFVFYYPHIICGVTFVNNWFCSYINDL